MAGNAPAGGGGGSANPFMGGSKLAFGLTLNPKKAKKKETKAPLKPALDLFAGAEDEAEAEGTDFRGAAQLAREQAKYSMANARVQAQHAAMLAEDPTVFDYDGVVDTVKEAREDVKQTDRLERKSQYIGQLLRHAKTREREQNIIYEKQLLKERQQEDHLYGDKDRFVTASYKKKLQEDAQWQHEEKMRQAREEEEDVTKRKDMSGMYYNLLKTNARYAGAPPPAAPEEAAKGKAAAEGAADAARPSASAAGVDAPRAAATASGAGGPSVASAHPQPAAARPESKEPDTEPATQRAQHTPTASAPTPAPAAAPAVSADPPKSAPKEGRRNDESAVMSAKERYLARKKQKTG